jgi:phage shock protein C
MEPTKRLTRSQSDFMIGGVCGGLAKYFAIDATLVRLIFVLLTVAGGSGVLIYFILWIVMPREDMPNVQTNLDSQEFSRRANQMGQEMQHIVQQPNSRAVQFIGIALVVLGLVYLVQNLNIPWLSWFNNQLLWPVIIIILGALLLTRAFRK